MKESSHNGYDNIAGIEDKVLLLFKENQESSPREYMYDRENQNIYSLDQGRYILVNNNNELVYEIKASVSNNANTNENIEGIASEQYLSKNEAIAIEKKNLRKIFQKKVILMQLLKKCMQGVMR